MGKKSMESMSDCPESEEIPEEKTERQTGSVIETGSIISDNGKYVVQCMTIIGQIEGHYIL